MLREVKRLWPGVPVVVLTGTGSEEIAVEAMKAGLDDYVIKSPHDILRDLPAAAARRAGGNRRCGSRKPRRRRISSRLLKQFAHFGLFHGYAGPTEQFLRVNGALSSMLGFEHPAEASERHAVGVLPDTGGTPGVAREHRATWDGGRA